MHDVPTDAAAKGTVHNAAATRPEHNHVGAPLSRPFDDRLDDWRFDQHDLGIRPSSPQPPLNADSFLP
jgi:hypothetical protein